MDKVLTSKQRWLERILNAVTILVLSSVFAALLWRWVKMDPAADLVKRVPGMDRKSEILAAQPAAKQVIIGESCSQFDGVPSEIKAEWPCFRGTARDNISKEAVSLLEKWEGGLPVLWEVGLGEGYAAPAVKFGRVYLLDYDEQAKSDALRCFSLDDGREIWRRSYRVPMKRNHGYSRTIPAVSDTHVVTIGPMCHVMCVEAISGNFVWGMDLVKDYGATVPLWYGGQCPLIDGNTAVIGIGGKDLIRGVDVATGNTAFIVPNEHGLKMSHSSVAVSVIHGKRMYLYAAIGGTVGVSAEEQDRGKVLWFTSDWDASVIVPTPVVLEDGRIFMTAGYGAGSIMLQVEKNGEGFTVRTLGKYGPREMLACEQQTPLYHNGRLYAVMPKDGGALARELVCYSPDGRLIWSSGKELRFGLGPFMMADGKFLVLDDEGELTMFRERGDVCELLARSKVLDGEDSWGPMALVDGRLLVRDSRRMVCLDLRKK